MILLLAKQHSLKSGGIPLRDGGGGDGVPNVESSEERGVHVYAERGAEVIVHHDEEGGRRKPATIAGKRGQWLNSHFWGIENVICTHMYLHVESCS